MNRYTKDKDVYVACIRRPDSFSVATVKYDRQREKAPAPLKGPEENAISESTLMPPPPPPPPRHPRNLALALPAVPSTSRDIRMASVVSGGTEGQGIPSPQESVTSWLPTIGNVRTLGEGDVDSTAGWDQDEMEVDGGVRRRYDQLSVMSSASQEVEELRRLGIPMEEIRTFAARQFDRYGNTMVSFSLI